MAAVNFYSGLEANVPTTATAGSLYFTTDTGNIYWFVSNSNKILIAQNQITNAINKKIYVQDTEPIDAQIGALWIDTSFDGLLSAEGVEF